MFSILIYSRFLEGLSVQKLFNLLKKKIVFFNFFYISFFPEMSRFEWMVINIGPDLIILAFNFD